MRAALRPRRARGLAPRAGHGLPRTEGTRGVAQERLRPNEIAELRHRDTAERERRCIVAQRDALQCAEGITRRERTRRGRNQRIHSIPEFRHTLVTPTFRCPTLNCLITTT